MAIYDETRAKIATSLMAAYLSSPHFKFEELSEYANKARIAAEILIKELVDNPFP